MEPPQAADSVAVSIGDKDTSMSADQPVDTMEPTSSQASDLPVQIVVIPAAKAGSDGAETGQQADLAEAHDATAGQDDIVDMPPLVSVQPDIGPTDIPFVETVPVAAPNAQPQDPNAMVHGNAPEHGVPFVQRQSGDTAGASSPSVDQEQAEYNTFT
ncbi:hypothetical protein E2562_003260 [Oryza meyeriana var. granulata]|uniref:Uncharacterized protein n=1 Tax=Oryza meyeriana var. granulata TaxID=110450 RepID=A0A6G1EUX1_9ORYZ|nr:hypothetical protein E2562_003260 [Oryza meyeriana var. granulata]